MKGRCHTPCTVQSAFSASIHLQPCWLSNNLALQGYSRAHPRSGRCLVMVGFGWGVVVGWGENTPPNHTQPNQKPIRARTSPGTKQRAMRRMVSLATPVLVFLLSFAREIRMNNARDYPTENSLPYCKTIDKEINARTSKRQTSSH